jgi:hypothetical protein
MIGTEQQACIAFARKLAKLPRLVREIASDETRAPEMRLVALAGYTRAFIAA